MPWVLASLISALFLGFYDLSKKHALRDNAVLPVLFAGTLCGAAVWLVLLLAGLAAPGAVPAAFIPEPLTPAQHGLVFLKSFIVASSWAFTYFGIKHLPLSLAAPIRATGPLWTLTGALLVLGERPAWLETAGILITLTSFYGLSVAGRNEGVHFHRNKWVGCMIAGTLCGAVSGLYDKYLLGTVGLSAAAVQAWFTLYLPVVLLPLIIGWWRRWWPRNEFHWRWSIPLIALTLLVADYVYFEALRDPEALVSVVSSLRRGSTLVAFAGGIWLFHEARGAAKLPAVLGIVAGIVLTVLG
ncbi:EamA-like transporter family protein [Lacunisphaera limnophila]|uniref:EamA-like transporter family protein n=1 Tax=Lacunisphaera limnophila TaxID=1838286 RepID=A0A1D8ASS5_9BACT|nr:DMT family transporter [Lacunisphaera limnophila]AOS43948.1 EamA-like transporter family protein [Lacunisphaera limnophila]